MQLINFFMTEKKTVPSRTGQWTGFYIFYAYSVGLQVKSHRSRTQPKDSGAQVLHMGPRYKVPGPGPTLPVWLLVLMTFFSWTFDHLLLSTLVKIFIASSLLLTKSRKYFSKYKLQRTLIRKKRYTFSLKSHSCLTISWTIKQNKYQKSASCQD